MTLLTRSATVFCTLQLGWAGLAWACSCAMPETATEKMDAVDAVFVGVVERNRGGGCGGFVQSSTDETRSDIRVTEAFKGVEEGETVELVHRVDGASCGIELAEGETWLIYARSSDGELGTGLCDGNQLEGDADADLAELRGEEG